MIIHSNINLAIKNWMDRNLKIVVTTIVESLREHNIDINPSSSNDAYGNMLFNLYAHGNKIGSLNITKLLFDICLNDEGEFDENLFNRIYHQHKMIKMICDRVDIIVKLANQNCVVDDLVELSNYTDIKLMQHDNA